nr:hypothetical protein [Tanacetum cinerariifolium]
MSTQKDIYAAGSESHPPMLNKENYVPWLSRLLRYAKSRPNGKLIQNSILNGPYVIKMNPEPADDQAIQTILLGLPEDIYAAVDREEGQVVQRKGKVIQNAVQNTRVQNVGNPNGLIGVQGNRNQNQIGNGNLVAACAEGNAAGQNGNQIRCYNCMGVGHYARNCTVRPRRRDATYLQTQLLFAQKKEVGIQLQAEEYDLMATASDLDEIKEVNANCILIANLHVEQGGETVEQHPANFEETRALYESLYQNLAIEVKKVNSVN